MRCPDCRAENPPEARACRACGHKLVVAERRHLNVLFFDLVGSTALAKDLDPEIFYDLLRSFHSTCRGVIGRFGGHIAQWLGDGALVYFGYPRAQEDDARRAVAAALEILRQVSELRPHGRRLQVRVGVDSGLVVVVDVEGHGVLAVGQTPNVAARVQKVADPNTAVITENTQRLVAGFFGFEPLAPRTLEGLSEPVALYRVLSESGARSPIEAAKATGLTPFVGRRVETEQLVQSWEEARAGRSSVVSIRGGAGVGKSRLVEVFESKLRGQTYEKVELFCLEYLRSSAFHPVIGALRLRLGLSSRTPPAQAQAVLRAELERAGVSDPQAAKLLAELLSIPTEGNGGPELPAALRRRATMDALVSWLRGLGAEKPTLLVLEDLQWADASTLELVDLARERLAGSRVLTLLTFRPDHDWPATLELQPFASAETLRLAAVVARNRPLPPELESLLLEWTGGVPLYIEEFTKWLLESEVLRDTGDAYELTQLPTSAIPDKLSGSLFARIDRLDKEVRRVVQHASVLGMEFRRDMLGALCALPEGALDTATDRLVQAELVFQSGSHPEPIFVFKHALIRQAAYDALSIADRQELHRRVVNLLRGRFQEVGDERPELVAYHASAGGLGPVAVAEWRRASTKALSKAANWEALAHIEHGVQEIRKLSEELDRERADDLDRDPVAEKQRLLQEELEFEIDRGAATMAVKGYSRAEVKDIYERARTLAEKTGRQQVLFDVLWGAWANRFVAGDLGPALTLGTEVVMLGSPDLIAPAHHAKGYPLCYMGRFEEALRLAEEAIAAYDEENENRNALRFQFSSTTAVCHIAAVSWWMLGYPDRAERIARRALPITDKVLVDVEVQGRTTRVPSVPARAYALSAATWGASFLRGDHAAVEAAADEAIAISKANNLLFWPALVGAFRGWAVAARGQVQSGLREMRECFELYQAAGGGILRPTISALIAETLHRAGDQDEALRVAERGLEIARSSQEHNYAPELHRIRGVVVAGRSLWDAAEESFRAGLDLARAQGARSLELRSATDLAQLWARRGRSAEARALLAPLYGWFTEGFDTPDLRRARAVLAELGDPAV